MGSISLRIEPARLLHDVLASMKEDHVIMENYQELLQLQNVHPKGKHIQAHRGHHEMSHILKQLYLHVQLHVSCLDEAILLIDRM